METTLIVGRDSVTLGPAAVYVDNTALRVSLTNPSTSIPLPTDRVTGALEFITTDHAAIHEGMGFSIYASFEDVANGNTRHVVVTTSATRYVHLKYYDLWISNASGILQIYENPQSVAGGTPITPVNRNRVSSTVSLETVVHTATLDLTGATLIETLYFGGGGVGPQGRVGGERSLDIEWVLKPSEQYVFLVTNTSGVQADINFWAFWYEEVDA